MPLLRSWNSRGVGFYKDVTPTAFEAGRANRFEEMGIQKIFDARLMP